MTDNEKKQFRGASQELSMSEWLGYSTKGGGAEWLSGWKKKGMIDVVYHPGGAQAILWAHKFFHVVTDNETGKDVVRMTRFNSMENVGVLRRARFRSPSKSFHSKRDFPPELCPFSLFLEWVREQIQAGTIKWTDEIFKFVPSIADDTVVIHAGGFTGQFGFRNLNEQQQSELRRIGVRQDEAYQESCVVKATYLMCVFDVGQPENKCVIAQEGEELGGKLQKLVRDRMESMGEDEGNPIIHPKVFRWKYNEGADLGKQYDAIIIEKATIPDSIFAKFDDEPPDLNPITAPSNVPKLRALFEKYWVHAVKPPWNDLFAKAMAAVAGTAAGEAQGVEDDAPSDGSGESTSSGASSGAADDDLVECDACHKGMPSTATVCPNCGQEYVVNAAGQYEMKPKEEPKKEESKPLPSRTSVGARVPRAESARNNES